MLKAARAVSSAPAARSASPAPDLAASLRWSQGFWVMLEYVNAALASLGRNQPLDHLAALGETLLNVDGLAIVQRGDADVAVGTSHGARLLDDRILRCALLVPATAVDEDASDDSVLLGTPIAVAADRRVIHFTLRADRFLLSCLIFHGEEGVERRAIARFAAAARRTACEQALMSRYRGDLKRYLMLFDHLQKTANIGVWEFDSESGKLYWSDQVFRILGLEANAPIPENWRDLVVPADATRLDRAFEAVRRTGENADLTVCVLIPSGDRRVVRVIANRQGEDPATCRVSGVIQDVTELADATEKLWWTANHDPMTGLPNRALFADRFRKALERRQRTGKLLAVVLIDVDKFKSINDTLGHAAGDELLRCVARSLKDAVRKNDTVARTGGDEFSVLMEDFADFQGLDAVLQRLKRSMDVRLEWDASVRHVSLSGGAAVSPEHGVTERDLLAAADLALYRMKGMAGPSLSVYRPSFGQAMHKRNQLLSEVRAALEAGDIRPYYQPQVDIATGRVVGVEALARWVQGDGTALSAGSFSEALQDDDLGVRIGQCVVDQAIAEIASINRGRKEKVALSVNASGGELLRESFLARLQRAQDIANADAGPVTVEITEDVILDDTSGVLSKQIQDAHEKGIAFSLDDFGTGYGSLVHMTTLPISEVKVDRRFVAGIEHDPAKQKVIRGIIDVARSLDMRLIVEGVETADQVALIVALGGHLAQGFYYSKAIPFHELRQLLSDNDGAANALVVGRASNDQSSAAA